MHLLQRLRQYLAHTVVGAPESKLKGLGRGSHPGPLAESPKTLQNEGVGQAGPQSLLLCQAAP